MTMLTDVQASTLTSSDTVYAARTRVRGMLVVPGTANGSVILKDGGSSGTTKLTVNTPAVVSSNDVFIPGEGILFETDVYCALTNADSVTIFYGYSWKKSRKTFGNG